MKKKKDLKFSEYNIPKYKGKKREKLLTSYDLMKYFTVEFGSEDELFQIANYILSGNPVLANFNDVQVDKANDMLAFISGVIYAKDGETHKISDKLFLFGRKEDYEDGSLLQYIEDTK
ncbi:MAG: cell division protein SepF [Bacilli bacterium]|jgi:cell division inhibitor SepF|nr:cell division protein SepF [Bacilli bacterium]MDD2681945.1 cell division protein SepF [Bacilli bacterium]MDD3121770.1 cell division protein SepF [Bacilli bacterium]MDD4063477.1 cell division protein SepF [Bacilli bacterium]MDD4481971.1 cell division protein SepF [Bacilli bacterium]